MGGGGLHGSNLSGSGFSAGGLGGGGQGTGGLSVGGLSGGSGGFHGALGGYEANDFGGMRKSQPTGHHPRIPYVNYGGYGWYGDDLACYSYAAHPKPLYCQYDTN